MHPPLKTGIHFAAVELGKFSDLDQFTFESSDRNFEVEGKVFLNQLLQLSGAEISINSLPPGRSVPFYHQHKLNEEVYIFMKGRGEIQVDGTITSVSEGSVIRVDQAGERCWRNTSTSEDLIFIVVQARAGSYSDHSIEDGILVQKPVSWKTNA